MKRLIKISIMALICMIGQSLVAMSPKEEVVEEISEEKEMVGTYISSIKVPSRTIALIATTFEDESLFPSLVEGKHLQEGIKEMQVHSAQLLGFRETGIHKLPERIFLSGLGNTARLDVIINGTIAGSLNKEVVLKQLAMTGTENNTLAIDENGTLTLEKDTTPPEVFPISRDEPAVLEEMPPAYEEKVEGGVIRDLLRDTFITKVKSEDVVETASKNILMATALDPESIEPVSEGVQEFPIISASLFTISKPDEFKLAKKLPLTMRGRNTRLFVSVSDDDTDKAFTVSSNQLLGKLRGENFVLDIGPNESLKEEIEEATDEKK